MPESSRPTSSQRSDEELAILACRGSQLCFEELVRRCQAPLVHFLRQWATPEEAEDLFQDAMLRAYENLHRYRPSSKFKTWLFTIARRLCLNLNRSRRPVESDEALATLAGSDEPAKTVAEAESRQRLWATVAELLDERERSALWLYYAEDMPIKEIAHIVDASPGAVKTMLHRSRKKLADHLDDPKSGGKCTEQKSTLPKSAEVIHE